MGARRVSQSNFELAAQHQGSGRNAHAAALYRKVLAAEPDHDQAAFLLGAITLAEGRPEEAVQLLEHAVQLAPENPAYQSNLGLAYRRLGAKEQARAALYRAVQLAPDLAEATYNLGLMLRDDGDHEASALCFSRAADFKPESFVVQLALAQALARGGRWERAVGHFQCALALSPKSADAHVGLMDALLGLERFAAVEAIGRRLLELHPNTGAGYRILARMYRVQLRFDEAEEAFRRAITLDRTDGEAHYYLGHTYMRLGVIEEAIAAFRQSILGNPRDSIRQSALVLATSRHPDYGLDELYAEARAWAKQHAEPYFKAQRPFPHDRSPQRKLRVGYVSPDFYDHVLLFFILPVLRQHDRSQIEVVCYSNVIKPDRWTSQVKAASDVWRETASLDHSALAALIREDRIDILIDLSLHGGHNRLEVFAQKPAPVQVSWLGYPGTTCLETIDYRITDPHLEPEALPQVESSEQALTLPNCFWCYDPLTAEPVVSPLPALTSGRVTFGSLNDISKLNPGVLQVWARVMLAVGGSRLLLHAPVGSARRRISGLLEAAGIDAERIQFVERVERLEYLATYQHIDLGLDCFPCNGGATTLDSLWMGVPVVTLVGRTFVGRAGLSLARNLGLEECVAWDPDEFVRIAVRLSADLPRLSELRNGLRARLETSPLMDAPRFARDLEAAYRTAWRNWCAAPQEVAAPVR